MSFVNETKSTPIENDTGANVRADINTNLAAIYSLNASSSEPIAANSVARMIWADEANDLLKIRNGTNTSFITIGSLNETNLGLATIASPTFTGNVGVPSGTVSSLPFRFGSDTDTGIFTNSANDFSIVTGGTRRAHFDSNGITIRDRKALRLRDTSNSNFVAIQAPSNVASDITLTLPGTDGNANDVLQSDGSGNLSFTALPQAVPTGSVHMMATTTAPSGYLKCDGAAVSRTAYADLFSTIGTTWGAGDGSSTFNLPDLRGEFVRGWDDGKGTDSGRSFASAQSDQNKQHNHTATSTTAISPSAHNHVFPGDDQLSFTANGQGGWTNRQTGSFSYDADSSTSGNGKIYRTSDTTISGSTSTSIANSGGNEARPRNIVMMYVIKT
jgi:microcystin-dependent protein